jgi:hypothetical protein
VVNPIGTCFHIYIDPPQNLYKPIISSIFEVLESSGWKHSSTERSKLDTLETEEFNPGSVNLILELPLNPRGLRTSAYWAAASFEQGKRWLGLEASINLPGRIQLGSDYSFFEEGDAKRDLRNIFSQIVLSEDTSVKGDNEFDIESLGGSWRFRRRIREYHFFWIDILTTPQWDVIRSAFPELEENRLASIGNKHLVMMGDSPYSTDQRLRRFPSRSVSRKG